MTPPPRARPAMKLASTRLAAHTLLPNVSTARWNQRASKMSAAAPERKPIEASRTRTRRRAYYPDATVDERAPARLPGRHEHRRFALPPRAKAAAPRRGADPG